MSWNSEKGNKSEINRNNGFKRKVDQERYIVCMDIEIKKYI